MTRYHLATDLRRRLVTRAQRPPVTMTPGLIAAAWPPARDWWWRPARTQWNALRWLTAQLWPRRWTGYRHPLVWRLGRLAWGVAAYSAYTLAAFNALVLATVWPLWFVVARLVGSGLILAGWTPPLAAVDVDPPETATLREPPAPHQSPPAAEPSGDPWDWNTRHDPYLVVQREALAEMRRGNDLVAAQNHQPAPAAVQSPVAAPMVAYRRPESTGAPPQRPLGAGRVPWRPAVALLWISIVMGAVFTIVAWVLAWLSALGVIGAPPTLDQYGGDPTVTAPTAAVDPPTTGATP